MAEPALIASVSAVGGVLLNELVRRFLTRGMDAAEGFPQLRAQVTKMGDTIDILSRRVEESDRKHQLAEAKNAQEAAERREVREKLEAVGELTSRLDERVEALQEAVAGTPGRVESAVISLLERWQRTAARGTP